MKTARTLRVVMRVNPKPELLREKATEARKTLVWPKPTNGLNPARELVTRPMTTMILRKETWVGKVPRLMDETLKWNCWEQRILIQTPNSKAEYLAIPTAMELDNSPG